MEQDLMIFNYFSNKDVEALQNIQDDYIKSLALISRVYRNNLDKSGNPEVGHFIRVSDSFRNPPGNTLTCLDDEIIVLGETVGMLHDVVEDGLLTFADLRNLNFLIRIIDSLILLNHNKNKNYHDYITGIINSNDELAIWTKYYDMYDNSNDFRLKNLDESTKVRLQNKYGNEYPRLQEKVEELVLKKERR